MADKPSLPRGTRDFGPAVMSKRLYIFDTIRAVFRQYGYMPLETPAMENLSVLTGKYGDEGDQLIFKILNSGNYLDGISDAQIAEGAKPLTKHIAEKALRYDLTVPFARFLAMNRNEVALPFRRYQMQPVWRADRPQKGRYREFYQCDADVAGTTSLICEAEIFGMIQQVFGQLGIKDYTIKFNHRGILAGLAELIGATGQEATMCVAIDKLDKIGKDGVTKELLDSGFSATAIDLLFELLDKPLSVSDFGQSLTEKGFTIPTQLLTGLADLAQVLEIAESLGLDAKPLYFDLSLARGLSYYTGAIFEVKINGVQIGSVSGGGRYDNLTGLFGWPNVPGVGFSFGVDRLYDCLQELNLFPEAVLQSTQVLVANFDLEKSQPTGLKILAALRAAGHRAEIYPEPAKLKKQLGYADAKHIPLVILLGEDELSTNQCTIKNMFSGEQKQVPMSDVVAEVERTMVG